MTRVASDTSAVPSNVRTSSVIDCWTGMNASSASASSIQACIGARW